MDRQNFPSCTCRNSPTRNQTSPTRGLCPTHNLRPATWSGAEVGNINAAASLPSRSSSTSSDSDNMNVSSQMYTSRLHSPARPRSPTGSYRNVEPASGSRRPVSMYATPHSSPCQTRPATQYYTPGSAISSSSQGLPTMPIPPPRGFRHADFDSDSETSPTSTSGPGVLNPQPASTPPEAMEIEEDQVRRPPGCRCCRLL